MIKVWFTNGVVQEYDTIEDAEKEIAEIMEKDYYPFAHIADDMDKVFRHRVKITLEAAE